VAQNVCGPEPILLASVTLWNKILSSDFNLNKNNGFGHLSSTEELNWSYISVVAFSAVSAANDEIVPQK
jgi:hypothetical protein